MIYYIRKEGAGDISKHTIISNPRIIFGGAGAGNTREFLE